MKDNLNPGMTRHCVVCAVLTYSLLAASAAQAESRLVVRTSLGLPGINLTCLLLGCQVVQSLGDPQGQLFVVAFPSILDPVTALLQLRIGLLGIVSGEIDQTVKTVASNAG